MGLVSEQKYRITLGDLGFAFLILLLVVLYDWRMMTNVAAQPVVNTLKFLIPFWMIFYVFFRGAIIPAFAPIRYYFLFFFLFLCSALGSSILAVDPSVSLMQWIKLLSRGVIAASFLLILVRWPRGIQVASIRILVYLALFVVIQYVILSICYILGIVAYPQFNNQGLLGILGTGLNTPLGLLRLTSFWFEPSKAAGFLFPMMFLAAWLYNEEKKLRWEWIAVLSFLGGCLCFSNAGYFALGAGVTVWSWYVYRHRLSRYRTFYTITLVIGVFILLAGVAGKVWVVTHADKGNFVATIFGVRGTDLNTLNGISEGRIQLAQQNIVTILQQNPLLGIGLQIPGENADGTAVDTSATAPILWVSFTGFLGLVLLLLIIWQVARCYFLKYMQKSTLYFLCAWVVSLTQQLVYGDWMEPFFLFLSSLVLVSAYFDSVNYRRSMWKQ